MYMYFSKCFKSLLHFFFHNHVFHKTYSVFSHGSGFNQNLNFAQIFTTKYFFCNNLFGKMVSRIVCLPQCFLIKIETRHV